MFLFALLLIFSPISQAQDQRPLTIDEIVQRMGQHNIWQEQNLAVYIAARHFFAENKRFSESASMDVKTSFHRPDKMQSTVVHNEGSDLIKSHLFDKVLEAETETSSLKTKQQVDIRPLNYTFALSGLDVCDGRKCYRVTIAPKRRDKYSVDGTIWIDAEDFAISRMQGKPAKKPSFWTLKTDIERHYTRVDGFWLPDYMDSSSDIFIAGHSTFRIDYKYESVQKNTGETTAAN